MFRRAYQDTKRQAGGTGGLFLLTFSPLLAFSATFWIGGPEKMNDAWISAMAALAAFGAAALLMFLYNLFAAPYRLQKERADALASKTNELSAQVDALENETKVPSDIRIYLQQVAWGQRGPDGQPLVAARIAVANVGPSDNTLTAWRILVRDEANTFDAILRGPGPGASISLYGQGEEHVMEMLPDNMIYSVMPLKIGRGEMKEGFICASVLEDILVKDASYSLTVDCADIFGARFESESHALSKE